MSRQQAIERVERYFDDGGFVADLGRRVAIPTESQNPERRKKPAILPNLGGSLPNDVFTDVLGLPTVWIPHSYASCSQHAPNEHLLMPIARDALRLMAGLMWDLGEVRGRVPVTSEPIPA